MNTSSFNRSNVLPFSNPFEKVTSPIVEIAVISIYRNSLNSFLEKNRDLINRYSSGIIKLFQLFIESCADYKIYADYSISCLDKVSYESDKEKIQAFANIACYLSVNGFSSKWSIKGIHLDSSYFDNFILDNIEITEIENDPIKYEINFTTTTGIIDVHYHNPMRINQRGELLNVQKTEIGNIAVFPVQIAPKIWRNRILGDSASNANDTFYSKVNLALELLRDFASPYLDWVDKITNKIIVFDSDSDSHIKSGSWEEAMSLYNLSVNHDVYIIAELLVHESSHQYFNLLKKIDDFAKPHESLYYSAAVDKDRPLWAILIAYHAFANIVLFYRMLIENKADWKEIIVEREKENMLLVNSLATHLVNNKYLTDTGKTLFLSLHERITNKSE